MCERGCRENYDHLPRQYQQKVRDYISSHKRYRCRASVYNLINREVGRLSEGEIVMLKNAFAEVGVSAPFDKPKTL